MRSRRSSSSLLNRYQQQPELRQQDLFNPTAIADYTFATPDIRRDQPSPTTSESSMTPSFASSRSSCPSPTSVIYLRADSNVLVSRIKKRGFEYERPISSDYLESLTDSYNRYFLNYAGDAAAGRGHLQPELHREPGGLRELKARHRAAPRRHRPAHSPLTPGSANQMKRLTAPKILEKHARGEKLSMVTAYDSTFARLVDEAGCRHDPRGRFPWDGHPGPRHHDPGEARRGDISLGLRGARLAMRARSRRPPLHELPVLEDGRRCSQPAGP